MPFQWPSLVRSVKPSPNDRENEGIQKEVMNISYQFMAMWLTSKNGSLYYMGTYRGPTNVIRCLNENDQ